MNLVNMHFLTSWDDGNILDLKVATLLQKYNLPGTFYIVGDWIGKKDYLTWPDVRELDQAGFEIGSHTMSHPQDLKALYDDQLQYEIQTSKEMIETVLGHPIKSFCYPRGRYDQRVIDQVIKAGYVEARTTKVLVDYLDMGYDKLQTPTTIHVFERSEYKDKSWFGLAKLMLDSSKYFLLFGHSWEVEKYNQWDRLEEFFDYVKNSNT